MILEEDSFSVGAFSLTRFTRREDPATKSAKKSGGSEKKIRGNSFLPKSDPNISSSSMPYVTS